jgi:solute carrier family 13 (sodium-dependent dicarboxylate transporter), member 2/3/5
LGCSYSASLGGMGSLIGVASNILLKGFFDENYPDIKVNFLTFSLFALPISILMILFTWILLSALYLPIWKRSKNEVTDEAKRLDKLKRLIKEKYKALGPIKWEEKSVSLIFLILVGLWLTRDLHVVPGWGSFFRAKFFKSSFLLTRFVFFNHSYV